MQLSPNNPAVVNARLCERVLKGQSVTLDEADRLYRAGLIKPATLDQQAPILNLTGTKLARTADLIDRPF